MGDPLAWPATRIGTPVFGSDGRRVGEVHEVEGDTRVDIFHGLVVRTGRRDVLVPAASVASISEGAVDLAIPGSAVENLGAWTEAGASAGPLGDREAPTSPESPAS